MKDKSIYRILVAVLAFGIFIVSCTQEPNPQKTSQPEEKHQVIRLLKGVSASPKSYQEDDFIGFLEKVKETQDILSWVGDWQALNIEEHNAPITYTELSKQYDYIPLIEVGHYIQSSGELFRPLDEEAKMKYKDRTLQFVEKYKPQYFGIGVETNIFAEKNPGEFTKFVPFYNEVYDSIKQVSPNTKVFTVFQLEAMKGLEMWGIKENQPHWQMIDRFNADMVAFTTYPGLFYRNPSDIPEDHYTEIRSYTSKPIAFTEIGWHSAASPQGWESSEAEQTEFLKIFFKLTNHLGIEIMVWSFMYDPDTFEPFDSMGLFRDDGTARPAWDVWIK